MLRVTIHGEGVPSPAPITFVDGFMIVVSDPTYRSGLLLVQYSTCKYLLNLLNLLTSLFGPMLNLQASVVMVACQRCKRERSSR